MMEFALIASGSKGNCFVVQNEGTCIVIDCGSTRKYLKESFQKLGIRKDDIDAVLITHDHSDHIAQINSFAAYDIYSPVTIEDICYATVVNKQPFSVGSLCMTPLALSHDARNTYGYVIESETEKLVYITDTGYVNESYIPLIRAADYYVMESNHDVGMLMRTRRPQYLKARIYGDQGHLCNEDCAEVLAACATKRTKMIILAHISQEANTRELALQTTAERLAQEADLLSDDLVICAAGQNEMIRKGEGYEKTDLGTVSCTVGLGCLSDSADRK